MTLHVLYVDDEPDIREVASFSLEVDPDIRVTSYESGAGALAALDAGLRPDAILLDVMMPGMDGPATLASIRERPQFAATPVVFITARAQTQEQERFRALGAVGVITKPFDPMSLAGELRKLLAKVGR
jgi:two-component system, OmpR family, response regulator